MKGIKVMPSIGFFFAKMGVISYQNALDVTSNNIANINTNGFKASRPSFADLIYTERQRDIEPEVQTGHGVRIDKTDMTFEQSVVRSTGRQLDFALLDEAFFGVLASDGEVYYSKDGSFSITETAPGTWELCDENGGFILDSDGERITVPFIGDTQEIDIAGLKAVIGRYRFNNPYGLDQIGDNYYQVNLSSGAAEVFPEAVIKEGFVEASSTNLANEMAKVIEYQRSFQANISMIRTHDRIEEAVNNLRN